MHGNARVKKQQKDLVERGKTKRQPRAKDQAA